MPLQSWILLEKGRHYGLWIRYTMDFPVLSAKLKHHDVRPVAARVWGAQFAAVGGERLQEWQLMSNGVKETGRPKRKQSEHSPFTGTGKEKTLPKTKTQLIFVYLQGTELLRPEHLYSYRICLKSRETSTSSGSRETSAKEREQSLYKSPPSTLLDRGEIRR